MHFLKQCKRVVCRRPRSPAQKSQRPNYFLALQVSTSTTVTDAIKTVHHALVDHTEALQKALVEPETAHLTVMVTALQTEADIQNAETAMDSFAAELHADGSWAEPMSLTLQGLSHFRHQVQHAVNIINITIHIDMLSSEGFMTQLGAHRCIALPSVCLASVLSIGLTRMLYVRRWRPYRPDVIIG